MLEELIEGKRVETVGELRALLADLPDDMAFLSYYEQYTGGDYDYDFDYPSIYLAAHDNIILVPYRFWLETARNLTSEWEATR